MMRFAYGLLGTSLFYMAQEAFVPEVGWFKILSEAGAVGVLGVLVFWLLAKTLPQITKRWSDDRKAFFTKLDQWENMRHEDSIRLNETLAQLREHCAATMKRDGRS